MTSEKELEVWQSRHAPLHAGAWNLQQDTTVAREAHSRTVRLLFFRGGWKLGGTPLLTVGETKRSLELVNQRNSTLGKTDTETKVFK